MTGSLLALVATGLKAQSIEEGIKLLETERYNTSKELFYSLINKEPGNALPHYYLGEAYYHLGKLDSAKVFYEKGLNLNKNEPFNYVGLGKLLLEENKPEEAKSKFTQALTLATGKANVRIAISEAYLDGKNKNPAEALFYANEAKKIAPNEPAVHIALGDAYIKQNDGSNAISSYEKAVELNVNFSKGYYKIGQTYMMSRSTEEAERNFQKTLSIDPGFAPVYRETAELFYQKKQYNEAVETYKKYIDLVGNDPVAVKRYASFLFVSKKYPEAISVIEALFEKEDSNSNLQRLLAYSYYEAGNFPEGLTAIEKYFTLVPSAQAISSDYDYYGKLLAKTGNDSLAVLNFEKALELDAAKIEAHNSLAEIYFNKKEYLKAAEQYAAKFSKLKGTPSALDLFEFGRSYYFATDYVKADSVFSMLVSKVPDLPIGYLWKARANSNLDLESEKGLAQPHYEQFISKATDTTKYKKELLEAYSYLGYLSYLQNDFTNSKTYWQKVKELDPENEKAREALKALK